jgi:hypothetical protein
MSKKNKLLDAFKKNIGQWVCGYCNSESNQPASTFREIKKLGYKFEEHSPNRWGKDLFCKTCNTSRTHYKLLSVEPEFPQKTRIHINAYQRIRILKLLRGKDAFTGASISSTPEIDHKVPWIRLEYDIDPSKLTDEQIIEHFQLLTREHNLLKDRSCGSCRATNIRPPFLEISFWYEGNEVYLDSCVGCGWYDSVKWREMLNMKVI